MHPFIHFEYFDFYIHTRLVYVLNIVVILFSLLHYNVCVVYLNTCGFAYYVFENK